MSTCLRCLRALTFAVLGIWASAAPAMEKVEVRTVNGAPQLLVDGHVDVPLSFYGIMSRSPRYLLAQDSWQTMDIPLKTGSDVRGLEIRIAVGNKIQPIDVLVGRATLTREDQPGTSVELLPRKETSSAGDLPANWRFYILPSAASAIKASCGSEPGTGEQGGGAIRFRIEDNPAGTKPWFINQMYLACKLTDLKPDARYRLKLAFRAEKGATFVGVDVGKYAQTGWTTALDFEGGEYLQQVKMAAAAGVHVHHFSLQPFEYDSTVTPEPSEQFLADMDAKFQAVLSVDPEARIILRFGTSPSAKMYQNDKDSPIWLRQNEGKTHIAAALSSDAWWSNVEKKIANILPRLEAKWGDRILIYHPTAYEGGEWNHPGRKRQPLDYGYGPVEEADFRQWAAKRYGEIAQLNAAWGTAHKDFDSVNLPDLQRRHTAEHGEFLDPQKQADVVDYFQYRNDGMTNAIGRVAHAFKANSKLKRPVMIFYGYTFELHEYAAESGHVNLGRLLENPDVDLIAAPLAYFQRGPGGPPFYHGPADSVALHGKIWMNEDDTEGYRLPGRTLPSFPETLEQTMNVYWRSFATAYVRRQGTWWMDLLGRGWLIDQNVWDVVGRQQKFWQQNVDRKMTFAPQIAVVVDERSVLYVPWTADKDQPTIQNPLLHRVRSRIGPIGTSVGYYLLDDVIAGRVDARMFVFLNAFALDARQRESLKQELKRCNATAVWMYAPGYIDPERRTVAANGIAEMTGLNVRAMSAPVADMMKPAGASWGRETFGSGRKDLRSQWFIQPEAGVTPVATYADASDKIAAAMSRKNGFTSVYFAGLDISTVALRHLAKQAGVWIYTESDDSVVADDQMVMIHAASDGVKEIHLPQAWAMLDWTTQKQIPATAKLSIEMKKYETRIFERVPMQQGKQMIEPIRVTQHPEANEQLLYFTSTSLLQDDKGLVFISDRSGYPNLHFRDMATGEERQLTHNQDGYLKSYVYFDGVAYKGIGRASVSLDAARGIVYYIQGRQICAVDIKGNQRVLAEYPKGQMTAFTHVSADGKKLCVPTTDARALDDETPFVDNKPAYGIDKRVQDENLSSYLRVYDTQSGRELAAERVEKAWITHVQFSPINSDLILYNHEWPADCGIRRMWLWDGKTHKRLRTEGAERKRADWACHEMWERDGSAIIYHGGYADGGFYLGRINADGTGLSEIRFPDNYTKYGHFTVGRPDVLVSDGYFQQPEESGKGCGAWISMLRVNWARKNIDWVPLCANGSSWKSQDSHPHPIFNHAGDTIYFSSDKDGKRAVYKIDAAL